ncbi:hypothetical protein TIFTF001_005007 [Ficus carica]|uniref:ARM repeat N-terminal plant domain-containing protein n=1 Tax=Ficus carica TaxID=3494 RepID=A0AA87ZKK1_FICCA|nr:hypothetical protein TIFTF001_005007 [Ficus carica]
MDSLKKKEQTLKSSCTTSQFCFFCTMKEPDSPQRRAGLANCFKQMPLTDDQENVLVSSGLFHIAMAQPDDPEFPSLGIFECMASLIQKGVNDEMWLRRDQNIYIPYYAAHIIGSYTMNKVEFAEKAVESGVIPPLMELLRGNKMSWVEQRVAVRALGHLASYERTFEALSTYEEEVVRLAMDLASTCVDVVYDNFVGVKDTRRRAKYQCDLLTRGVGGFEMENCKAEEWTSQLQCWSLYLLNCFAYKERSLNLICEEGFLRNLCGMWGGLANHVSPAGVGLIRILCYSKYGRKKVAELNEVVESLCNLSRSSDDWQYMGIDCLLLLLKDTDTRYKVIDIAFFFLVDLVEIKDLGDRSNFGEAIIKVLLLDYHKQNKVKLINISSSKARKAVEDLWDWNVERRRKERAMSDEKLEERRVLVGLIKQQASRLYCLGEIEEATRKYSEALALCPLSLRKERMVLYSNRARCRLLLEDPSSAIRDSTRALCLSTPANSHRKSLWRRSQAYDMKGLAKESLMDCIMFIKYGCIKSDQDQTATKPRSGVKIPYYAARMISKQMDATWLFATARSRIKESDNQCGNDEGQYYREEIMMRKMMDNRGLSTIREEPLVVKEDINRRKVERARRISKRATSQIGLPHDVGVAEIQCGGPTKRDRYSKFSSSDFISF